MIHTPPKSWRLMAYCRGKNATKASAPALTISDANLAVFASSCGEASGRKYSRYTLRVKRLAAAIDMIDAGTSAPMATAANAMPTNQDGNIWRNNAGTTHWAPYGGCGWMPAASAI